jgi:hypothetical protein
MHVLSPHSVVHLQGLAPKAALKMLADHLKDDCNKRKWTEGARAAAVLGSCPRTMMSVKSGVRNYMGYCEVALGSREAGFPPTIDVLLGWSHTHRCVGTFSNYLGHVASACLAIGIDCPSTSHPALCRAKQAIMKRMVFESAEQQFVRHSLLRNMIRAIDKDGIETESFAMLCLFSYVFLLRVPSEALPVVRGSVDCDECAQSVLWLDGDELCLKLRRRKNKLKGSLLRRRCHCEVCGTTCPIHRLWKFFEPLPVGHQPFAGISANKALSRLRCVLKKLGMKDAEKFNTKSFRRGHAEVWL